MMHVMMMQCSLVGKTGFRNGEDRRVMSQRSCESRPFFLFLFSTKNDVLSCQETEDKSERGDDPRQGVVGEAVLVKKVKIHDTGAHALIDFGQDHLSGDLGWEGRFNGGGGSWGTWEREGGKSRGKTGYHHRRFPCNPAKLRVYYGNIPLFSPRIQFD